MRICRRNYAVIFCEHCQDHDARLIALNDSIDTGRPDWQMHAMFSAYKHESYNRDTSKRIRQVPPESLCPGRDRPDYNLRLQKATRYQERC